MPDTGDLPGLDSLLDVILGPTLAELYGADIALLERIECKLGMVLDRHHPEKVEAFNEMVSMTKSPMIKEKNLQVFVKSIMTALVEDASRPPPPASAPTKAKATATRRVIGGNNKRRSAAGKAGGGGGAPGKRVKRPAAAASKSSPADSDVSSLDEISKSSSSEDGDAGRSKKSVTVRKPVVAIESYDSVMADSDWQMRGQLHLVERCPALVYSSWRDADHDVYLYQFPQLAAAKREAKGIIAFFMGFGLYKEFTAAAFKSIVMPGDQPSRLRSREDIFAFLEKGSQLRSTAKGGSGEGARRKAYIATWQFFQKNIFKEAVTEADPFPPLARRVPNKGKKRASTSSSVPKKPRPRAPLAPAPLPPLPPASLPVAVPAPSPPPPSTSALSPPPPSSLGMTSTGEAKSKDEAGVTVTSSEGAPSPLGEEAQDGAVATAGGVWNTMPDPEDRSIRGLFASLRWRLLRLEETWEGGDQFVWTLKSSQSNIDNLCDSLFGDAGDPEADDWRRMVGSSLDKARRKLEDKLRALGGQGGNAATGKPAYVHGRALLDVYSELKEAVAGFEEGKETEVEGWDSLDFPVRELTSAPTTVAATSAASVSEPGAVLPSAEGAEPAVAGKEDRPEGAEEENREHGEENGGTRESGGGDRAREVGDAHGSGEESPPAGVAPEPSEEGKHVRPEQSGKEEDVGKEKLEPVSTKLSGGLLEEGPALPSVSKAAAADSDPLLKACVDSENGPSQGGSPLSSRDSYSKASTQGQLEKCEPGAD